jgi:hypothetical protein
VFDQDFNKKFTKGHNIELGIFFLDIGYVCPTLISQIYKTCEKIFPSLAASYQKGWMDRKDIGNL